MASTIPLSIKVSDLCLWAIDQQVTWTTPIFDLDTSHDFIFNLGENIQCAPKFLGSVKLTRVRISISILMTHGKI